MSLLELVKDAVKNGAQAEVALDGAIYSMSPPETLFGFTVWSHMIPPVKPEHTCILGYGKGQAAELMRKIWGQVKITGIDKMVGNLGYNEYKIKVMDINDNNRQFEQWRCNGYTGNC